MKKAALSLVLVAACAEPADRPEAAPVSNAVDVAAGCRQFANEGLKLQARSRAGLIAEAGQPGQTIVTVEPNRHDPNVQDSIFKFEYDGLTVQIRKPGPGGELVEYVAVAKRKWLKFPYFKPGVSATSIIQAIGEPQRREGDNLVYTCGGGEVEEPVVFEIKEGTVQRIVFNYYVD